MARDLESGMIDEQGRVRCRLKDAFVSFQRLVATESTDCMVQPRCQELELPSLELPTCRRANEWLTEFDALLRVDWLLGAYQTGSEWTAPSSGLCKREVARHCRQSGWWQRQHQLASRAVSEAQNPFEASLSNGYRLLHSGSSCTSYADLQIKHSVIKMGNK